jgi:hypothetical protein
VRREADVLDLPRLLELQGDVHAWEQEALSARGFQEGSKPPRRLHIDGVEVRKKRPRGLQ